MGGFEGILRGEKIESRVLQICIYCITFAVTMQWFENFLATYHTEGLVIALVGVLFFLFQIGAVTRFSRVAAYRMGRRKPIREEGQPVSLIIPMFGEDYTFIEDRLPLLFEQDYPLLEVVIVYVGQDSDFHEELTRLRMHFPHLVVTRVHLDSRFPVSRKIALNIGIKAAHNECMIFSSTDTLPRSKRWISLMAKGFTRGDVVLGYSAPERKPGLVNRMVRTGNLFRSAAWLARAASGKPYRGSLHNFGFTRSLYFDPKVNGFNHLGMNIGEHDLFLQQVATSQNTSIVLSPSASVDRKLWSTLGWWISQLRYFGAASRFYSGKVKWHFVSEQLTRVIFFATAMYALIAMPAPFRWGAAALLVVRYLLLQWQLYRLTRRLGERGILGSYLLYDLFSPLWNLLLGLLLLRKDERVWR